MHEEVPGRYGVDGVLKTADHYDAWLDPRRQDADQLRALLTPPAGGHLKARPVTTAVNGVRNNGPELLEEIKP